MRCNRCGGVMLANMPEEFKDTDDHYQVACIMCGHDNAPPVTIEELRARDKAQTKRLTMMADDGTDQPRRKGRAPRDWSTTPPSQIPGIVKDGTYARVLVWLKDRDEAFIAHEVATALEVSSASVGSSLRRAKADGLVQIVGSEYMKTPHRGQVDIWQAVRESQEIAS